MALRHPEDQYDDREAAYSHREASSCEAHTEPLAPPRHEDSEDNGEDAPPRASRGYVLSITGVSCGASTS
jgi:hypothetical protein